MVQKVWYSYDDIHRVVQEIAEKIKQSGIQYEAIIAIGGGGFIPARMLRTFLGEFLGTLSIYAVSTKYYDSDVQGKAGDEIQKIQWLDSTPTDLKNKKILVVDEVDDSRVTMEFVLTELQKDGFNDLGVAVIHNKRKPKKGKLPENIAYFSGLEIDDWWINYPWDALDIDEHNQNTVK